MREVRTSEENKKYDRSLSSEFFETKYSTVNANRSIKYAGPTLPPSYSRVLSGLNKYSVILSSNILRNTSQITRFPLSKRFNEKLKDYHTNIPYYTPNLNASYKSGPVLYILT